MTCLGLLRCGGPSRADVPHGMHHGDSGYDVNDPALTEAQREILEFPVRNENRLLAANSCWLAHVAT